ncbi:GNAT family N-acetyltransferase [Pelomonas aquatica]|jgi:RimJ/RimL family protein N-acetyltransferase|uniref:N-acetyltransferase n=1 Tax=Pelomonas aquatica TaxID=431058 RepID=A0A9X4LDF4_9BURK|nr:GNAT family protein [Pelomonas aquatica]MCY4753379.1 GNAT family protein [Pelomonas aquatica]MDG0861457.1 N-acetyltransferase [Pelomonas aquatica]
MNEPDPPLIDVPERLDGERIVLLAPRAGLGAEMAVVIAQSLSHLRPWMPWAQEAPTAESSERVVRRMQADFIMRRDLCFQIYARRADGSPGRMLGGAGLHRIDWAVRRFEVGYWIRPEAAGQGHVGEAVRLLAALAFEQLGARRVEIRCDPRNVKSRAVAERAGFELEGVLRRHGLDVDGRPCDTCVFSRLE